MLASAARAVAQRPRLARLIHASCVLGDDASSTATLGNADAPPPPLAGVRVLDVGQVVAGNFAGALLGYFGMVVWGMHVGRGNQKP